SGGDRGVVGSGGGDVRGANRRGGSGPRPLRLSPAPVYPRAPPIRSPSGGPGALVPPAPARDPGQRPRSFPARAGVSVRSPLSGGDGGLPTDRARLASPVGGAEGFLFPPPSGGGDRWRSDPMIAPADGNLLEVRGLKKYFPIRRGVFSRTTG